MKDLLAKAKPSRLEDLTALNALYRPGPMDLIPTTSRARTATRRRSITTTAWKPMLEETFGIMVYQEQVMQAAQIIGGYSLRWRRSAAPRNGQEEARGDGEAPRHL